VNDNQHDMAALPAELQLVLLNLLFLGTIAFVPYPTALLSAAGDQVPATVFLCGQPGCGRVGRGHGVAAHLQGSSDRSFHPTSGVRRP
jgi:hypothetical protein